MASILVVTGSARSNSINKVLTEQIVKQLEEKQDVNVNIADVNELGLPFFDAPIPPSAPGYAIDNDRVQAWSDMVKAADGVVFVMPEYNHAMSAIQKNALDWLYTEWSEKPAAIVTYGWYAGAHAVANFSAINDNIKLSLVEPLTQLQFSDHIAPDGTLLNEEAVVAQLDTTLDALIDKA